MFGDPTIDSIVFHDLTKFLGALALIWIWVLFVRMTIMPWYKLTGEASGAEPPRSAPAFPTLATLVMVALSGLFAYYVSMEPAFRHTERIPAHRTQDKESPGAKRQREAAADSPNYSPPVSIDKLTEQTVEKNRKENEAAKERFSKLPPVRSNQTGGAEANEPK